MSGTFTLEQRAEQQESDSRFIYSLVARCKSIHVFHLDRLSSIRLLNFATLYRLASSLCSAASNRVNLQSHIQFNVNSYSFSTTRYSFTTNLYSSPCLNLRAIWSRTFLNILVPMRVCRYDPEQRLIDKHAFPGPSALIIEENVLPEDCSPTQKI